MKHKAFPLASFKAIDEEKGIFEAIVAVFGNVDAGGDKIIKGAFAESLADWKAKGRPIPVIFSHEWQNLDAHIGEVLDAREVADGLYVKAQLDLEEEYASRVYKKMRKGTLAEFSFAYDVLESNMVDQGEGQAGPRYVNELRKLDLYEVGPCLKGMNPDTQLIAVKAGARHSGKDNEMLQQMHDLAVELGAKCAEHDDSADDGDGGATDKGRKPTAKEPRPSTLAARVAIDLMENE